MQKLPNCGSSMAKKGDEGWTRSPVPHSWCSQWVILSNRGVAKDHNPRTNLPGHNPPSLMPYVGRLGPGPRLVGRIRSRVRVSVRGLDLLPLAPWPNKTDFSPHPRTQLTGRDSCSGNFRDKTETLICRNWNLQGRLLPSHFSSTMLTDLAKWDYIY